MKVLITGGVGFIGQYVARQLVDDSHEVVALDSLLPQVHIDPAAAIARFPGEVIEGDVSDPESWTRLPEVDGIVHLAAETGTGQSMYEVDRYTRVNVDGTRLAAEYAAERGLPIVFTSSRAVYGEGRYEKADGTVHFGAPPSPDFHPVPSREDDEHVPVSVYGETKSDGEKALVAAMQGRAHYAIIRPQNVIGFGQALHNPYTGVLAAFLSRLKEGRTLSVYGDGSATRDFVHVSDVARIIGFALQRAAAGEDLVLNAGSGERINLTQLAEYSIAGSKGEPVGIEYVEVHRAGDIENAAAAMDRLADAGGPAPAWSPAAAVADFIQKSWDQEGADSSLWDDALSELGKRGLTS